MTFLVRALIKFGILKNDLDYHLLRTVMVIICLLFGYQKWFEYEAQALVPYISHGPLIFWLYPAFGIRGATYFLGVSEWLFGALLFAGFWNKKAGILGALGMCFAMLATATIIPFIPGGWAASAGGFPAMTERVAFLMKDLVIFAVSFYLLRQDVIRASLFKTTALAAGAKAGATQGTFMTSDAIPWKPADPRKPDGVQMFVVWGNPREGPSGVLLKFPAGTEAGWHRHTAGYQGIVIQGHGTHTVKGEAPQTGGPASVWSQPAGQVHDDKCEEGSDCIEFAYFDGKLDFVPVDSPYQYK